MKLEIGSINDSLLKYPIYVFLKTLLLKIEGKIKKFKNVGEGNPRQPKFWIFLSRICVNKYTQKFEKKGLKHHQTIVAED